MSTLLQLLKMIEMNNVVETYRYFPDVAISGGCFIEKDDLDRLIDGGYLQAAKQDSFGAFLELSNRAKAVLQNRDVLCAA